MVVLSDIIGPVFLSGLPVVLLCEAGLKLIVDIIPKVTIGKMRKIINDRLKGRGERTANRYSEANNQYFVHSFIFEFSNFMI